MSYLQFAVVVVMCAVGFALIYRFTRIADDVRRNRTDSSWWGWEAVVEAVVISSLLLFGGLYIFLGDEPYPQEVMIIIQVMWLLVVLIAIFGPRDERRTRPKV